MLSRAKRGSAEFCLSNSAVLPQERPQSFQKRNSALPVSSAEGLIDG